MDNRKPLIVIYTNINPGEISKLSSRLNSSEFSKDYYILFIPSKQEEPKVECVYPVIDSVDFEKLQKKLLDEIENIKKL